MTPHVSMGKGKAHMEDKRGGKMTANRNETPAGSGKIGLADIAQQAEASIGTVFNYLNYPDRVSKSMKERIRKAIADLNYVPRPARIGSAITGQETIGIIMTDIGHSLFTSIFEGAQEVCEDNDMELIGVNAYSDSERQSRLLRLLYSLGVKGVLLCSVNNSSDDLTWAASVGLPVVLVDRVETRQENQNCSVLEDNTTVGRLAAQNLLAAGCRNVAFVAHSFDYQSIYDRYLGAREALQDVTNAQFNIIDSHGILKQDGYAVGKQINEEAAEDIPDGIITATDYLGIGIIKALSEYGKYQVPDDIKIVGTEGIRLADYPTVPLSTAVAPGVDMGRKAVSLLLDEINNRHHVHGCVLIPPTFISRESSRKSKC